ncbi:MAG: tyrosine-protein phosphatase, partial [Bacteroidia bacterium]|nr:tyrosine-protein phosphatase [Bacteroidia bacterium]MDW8335118.1 tyrosine-protein phosphatase [Bacteroidia bacterium]
ALCSWTELERLRSLNGTLSLREAGEKKRRLLDFFSEALEKSPAVSPTFRDEVRRFLEAVHRRDFFGNFRDLSRNNERIRPGVVFRCACLAPFQNEPLFDELIDVATTFVDLRADYEIAYEPYSPQTLSKIRWVNCPMDPSRSCGRSGLPPADVAYRFFAAECGPQIVAVLRAIIEAPKATLIHCAAGKDRTGCVAALLHLLSGASLEIVLADHLASEMDTNPDTLKLFLEIVEQRGGVHAYLLDSGMTQDEIQKLTVKISL